MIFAHGSGSGRHSPRNKFVARVLNTHGLATLLADLLTPTEEAVDHVTPTSGSISSCSAGDSSRSSNGLANSRPFATLPIGLFGASTGAAAALVAAAARPRKSRPSSRAAAGRIWRARRYLTSPRQRC